MLSPRQMNSTEKQLLKHFKSLAPAERETLLAFAEFLLTRSTEAQASKPVPEPEDIPRPQKETVVAAIKRLSATYPMLDKPELLNETSVLMTQHVMQGRDIVQVIDELEALFRRFYEELVNARQQG
jgi:hypothetical protein